MNPKKNETKFSSLDYEYIHRNLEAIAKLIEGMGAWHITFEGNSEVAAPLYMLADMVADEAKKVEALFNETLEYRKRG